MSDLPDIMFKKLTKKEEADYRKWAREHHVPGTKVEEIWHPVVREECAKMNVKHIQEEAAKQLNVGELFQAWREAYNKAYGHYPRMKLIE